MVKVRPAHYVRAVGDTYGPIELVVVSGLPNTVTTGTTCVAAVRTANATELVEGVTAAVVGPALSEDGETYGATLRLSTLTNVTTTAGRYWIQFTLTHTGGTIQTLPPASELTLEVVPAYRLYD